MADQSNSGKNALILGAVFGLAAAGLGAYTMMTSKVVAPDTMVNGGKSDNSLTAQAEQVKANLKSDRTVTDAAPEGALINGKPRMAPLFFSTELWQVSSDAQQKNTIIDIYDPAAPSVHADVPNSWFITNGIADALGRADGMDMDSDKDGFSNREEFLAHTSPSDAAAYPALVRVNEAPKLEVADISSASAVLSVSGSLQYDTAPTEAEIRVFSDESATTPTFKKVVKPGQTFGLKDGDNRFTFVKFDKVVRTDLGGNKTDLNVIVVRDNETANPDNKEFIIVPGTPRIAKAAKPDDVRGRQIKDKTITLRVTAGNKAGSLIKCQEKGSFTIPGGYSDGKPMAGKLETIDKGGSVNITIEGLESPVQVPKAGQKTAPEKK